MGREAQVRAILTTGSDEGRLQFEASRLIFRGANRHVFESSALADVRAEGGELVLADGTRFALGEKAAAAWAQAIANPKSRMDKIGAKAGMRAAILEVEDADLEAELTQSGVMVTTELAALDLLFVQADTTDHLTRIMSLEPALAPKGALWIVSRKGKAATIKDIEIMAAAKTCGLTDNKVVGFSMTLTALRFVRRARR